MFPWTQIVPTIQCRVNPHATLVQKGITAAASVKMVAPPPRKYPMWDITNFFRFALSQFRHETTYTDGDPRLGNLDRPLKLSRFCENKCGLPARVCVRQSKHFKHPLGLRTPSPSIGSRSCWPGIESQRKKVSHFQRPGQVWKNGSRRTSHVFTTNI